LDFYDLGGDVSWQAPNDTEHLDAYLVYLAEGAIQGAIQCIACRELFYMLPSTIEFGLWIRDII